MSNMNIEQVCSDAIIEVESYLANNLVAGEVYDELCEAQEAVDRAWDIAKSRTSHCMCRAAWHACLAAKNDERNIAKMYVNAFWEQV